ncbi:MAG: dTDP-4-dehydrorhamnose 3,5-epimerase [Nanoarchaeota archaeon]|nr:dTDP-4-dehydrorhamnose 3,5-epimerase [Nanoarchaeota archaeon]
MEFIKKNLKGFIEIIPEAHEDNRGFLARLYDQKTFKENDINNRWIQDSHSHTSKKGTLRGLHIQTNPFSEAKLIRAIKGRMKWIVVDLRKDSKTFGKWESVELSEEKKNMIFVSRGFGHGCVSMTDDCDLVIKSDNLFSPEHGAGIIWNDPELGINWGIKEPFMSERDSKYPSFKEFKDTHGGI